MRIAVIGAGPAGLYLAILMKKADSHHEVVVVERNAPDATYGWGVVFSEETLGALRDADDASYADIEVSFTKWGSIDIVLDGRTVRSRGHVFAAIARKRLLALLQRRASDLGVELRFLEELDDLSALEAYDLLVGADGANSTVRGRFADAFEPRLQEYESRYVWFGTDLVFDAFTFVFRPTEHGMFQAHAYPFDASLSTVIVECNEATWRRAGLDGADEDATLAFCEELFRPELRDHRLLSNRSNWGAFVQVSNRVWHHGNVVLLGDAAHTAHFTIGSGTKLAMEDAVAMAAALGRTGELETALTEYELERQPVVERFQVAARLSADYFEHAIRYAGFHPVQFAFNLLTRSGRITHGNLALRDAAVVQRLDAWFAEASPDCAESALRLAPPPLFAPLELGGITLLNRIVLVPGGRDDAEAGMPGEDDRTRFDHAARAGAGLVLTEPVAVSADGRITPGCLGLYRDEHVEAWRSIVEAVHRTPGARIGVQLGHAGRRGATRPRTSGVDLPLTVGGWPLVSASQIPYTSSARRPAEITVEEMARVRGDFAAAARRAVEAGFDLLELNLAHGYLPASFLSRLTNARADDYGGTFENRLRFPLELIESVRETWSRERPFAAKFTAADLLSGGVTEAEAVEIASALAEHGCALLEPVAGQTTSSARPRFGPGFLTPLADLVRSSSGIPVVVGGYLTTVDQANTILGAGRADLCVLTLAL